MSQSVIKSLFAQRSRDFLKDVLSRYVDGGPKAPDILLVVKTSHPGALFPDYLKEDYPESIHLVFGGYSENLVLGEFGFDVTLSFGDGYEDLSIPFDAIEGLVCQDEGFALQLPSLEVEDEEAEETPPVTESEEDEPTDDAAEAEAAPNGGDNVVALDAFRRK
jgi:hypothetical protein